MEALGEEGDEWLIFPSLDVARRPVVDPAVPTGGLIAGFSSARQLELMAENGFKPLKAIRVSTLNGAIYLGRADGIGSIAPGKQADLIT